jgi:acid stress chaperone HdeA
MKRFSVAVVTVLASAVFAVGGCSNLTKHKGGDTTCEEFKDQDVDTQTSEVAQMLKDQKGEEAPNGEISAARLSVEVFCRTIGKDNNKISDITHT